MRNIVRSTLVALMLGAASLGAAGAATANSLNDPMGLCDSPIAGNCVYGTGHPRSSVTIEFPSSAPQQQAIVDYVTNVAEDYYAAEALVHDNTSAPPSELDVTATGYASGTPHLGTQSVVLKSFQMISGAAHPNIEYKAFSSNNATGAPITFDSLFRPGTKPLDVIMPIADAQISADVGEPFVMGPVVGLDPANYQNFAITDDAVLFFFDKNQLQPATGSFEVSVPRSAIATLLTPGI